MFISQESKPRNKITQGTIIILETTPFTCVASPLIVVTKLHTHLPAVLGAFDLFTLNSTKLETNNVKYEERVHRINFKKHCVKEQKERFKCQETLSLA